MCNRERANFWLLPMKQEIGIETPVFHEGKSRKRYVWHKNLEMLMVVKLKVKTLMAETVYVVCIISDLPVLLLLFLICIFSFVLCNHHYFFISIYIYIHTQYCYCLLLLFFFYNSLYPVPLL